MSALARLERVSLAVAIVAGLLVVLSATGIGLDLAGRATLAWFLHPLLLLLGAGAGIVTILRGVEIDRNRWEIVNDSSITKGEREYAHKEAERQRRVAGTLFLLGPVLLALWFAYQLRGDGPELVADLLIITPLVGFLAGILYGRRFDRPPPS